MLQRRASQIRAAQARQNLSAAAMLGPEEEEMDTDRAAPRRTDARGSKLRRRADHFRRLITGDAEEGLISRLPDDLLLNSVVGDANVLDSGDVEEAEDAEKNKWYSTSKDVLVRKRVRRRHKRTPAQNSTDISDMEIHIRILDQCLNDTVQQILLARETEDGGEQAAREALLHSVIEEVFLTTMTSMKTGEQ